MTLSKRYTRNIRENLSFYLSATVLTVVALLLYYVCNIAGYSISDFATDFFERNRIEDAHFSTYLPIPDDDISELESEYDIVLEPQRYVNIETDGVTARVFERTDEVDLYEVTAGRDVEADGETVISEGYATANGVELGDTIGIGGKDYEVVGYMQRPDYLYMLENEDDSYKNSTTFFLCYLSDADFDALGDTSVQYLVRYGDGTDTTAFRRSVNDGWVMRSYSSGNNNWRISMVTEQLQVFIVMSYVMLATMPLITVVLISIILRRKVASEQRMIGTLSAMGYTKGRLARHYVGFAVLPGIVGGIIAAVIAVAAAQPLAEFGLTDYEPMHVTGHLNPVIAVVGILVPTAMYALAALCAVRKLLKRDTVELLNGNAGSSRKARHLLAGSRMNFKYKFAIRTILGNPTRSLVIVLGVFLGCFITLWGLGMFDSMDNAGDAAASEMGSYQHQYVLNRLLSENPYGGETLLVSSMESDSGDSVAVIGTDADNGLLNLADEDGNAVDVEDGYYVTSLASYAYGWREGDTVTLTNPFTLEETDIKVAGVVRNNVQKAVVAGKGLVEDLTGLDAELFNSIVSKTALSIPESEVAKEIRTSSFREQADTMVREVSEMLWLIFALGAILCVASVYVAVDMLLNESRSNISMLKVLGYRDRKIDRIVLDANHVLLPIGILLAVPAAVAACDFYFGFLVDYGLMLMQTRIAPSSYAISIGITVACYAGSLLLLRGKVKRVDMVECLKDNRE